MHYLFLVFALIAPIASYGSIVTYKQTEISDVKEQGEDFKPSMLYFVDKIGKNRLFRGNMPQENSLFAYDSLNNALKSAGMPGNFKIIDISLLNPSKEHEEVMVEIKWFKENKNVGDLHIHPIHGAMISPSLVPAFIGNFYLKHHDVDSLKSFIPKLRKLLKNNQHYPRAIYIHCNAGKDRTGEVCACYLMRYKGYSYEDALSLDNQIAQRSVEERNRNAMKWYAFYLRDVLHIATIGKID